MNTTENNKLIAEFMGYKQDAKGKYEIIEDFDIVENIQTYVEDDDYRTVVGGIVLVNFLPEEMRFHTSWDWLMPVVEKINETGRFEVNIGYGRCYITDGEDELTLSMVENQTQYAVYRAVVEFIKWYNENK